MIYSPPLLQADWSECYNYAYSRTSLNIRPPNLRAPLSLAAIIGDILHTFDDHYIPVAIALTLMCIILYLCSSYGQTLVTATPWSHSAQIREVPLCSLRRSQLSVIQISLVVYKTYFNPSGPRLIGSDCTRTKVLYITEPVSLKLRLVIAHV